MNLLENARLEAEELKRQRDAFAAVFDAKIAAVEQTIKMLEPVYSPTMPPPTPLLDESVGITEAIETALRKYPGKLLAPTAVRDALIEMKFKITGENPMASVHQVLKRLIARSNTPYVSESVDGQTVYKFDPAKEPIKTRRGLVGMNAEIDTIAGVFDASRSRSLQEMARYAENAERAASAFTPPIGFTIPEMDSAIQKILLGTSGASGRINTTDIFFGGNRSTEDKKK